MSLYLSLSPLILSHYYFFLLKLGLLIYPSTPRLFYFVDKASVSVLYQFKNVLHIKTDWRCLSLIRFLLFTSQKTQQKFQFFFWILASNALYYIASIPFWNKKKKKCRKSAKQMNFSTLCDAAPTTTTTNLFFVFIIQSTKKNFPHFERSADDFLTITIISLYISFAIYI